METLHHIALPVTVIDKAVDWYEENFDIRKVYADESWALLEFENISVALVLPDQHSMHIAVERENAETLAR
jgi:catechol 2,3-dioxygenase-like lactoylglutathione lyase family enzyme